MLNPRQENFCIEYARSGNATQAYKTAYEDVTDATAQVNGSRLLADIRIKDRLRELQDELHNDKIADVKELQTRLTKIMRGEEFTSVVTKEGEVVTVPVGMKDRLKAAEMLLKTHGAFINKQEIELSEVRPVVIVDNI